MTPGIATTVRSGFPAASSKSVQPEFAWNVLFKQNLCVAHSVNVAGFHVEVGGTQSGLNQHQNICSVA